MAAVESGLGVREWWSLTPGEIAIQHKAWARRTRREHEAQISFARLNAILTRTKRIPSMAELGVKVDSEGKPARPLTARDYLQRLKAVHGDKIRIVKKESPDG